MLMLLVSLFKMQVNWPPNTWKHILETLNLKQLADDCGQLDYPGGEHESIHMNQYAGISYILQCRLWITCSKYISAV